ncbi:MAG: hypothetical protein WBL63_04420 [Candidatus Acidiferrum sp.]
MGFTATKSSAWSKSPRLRRTVAIWARSPALAACRENQAALARKLLRELIEQYPDSELFASEYAKVSSLPLPAALAH